MIDHVLDLAPPSIRQEIVATVVEKTKQWAEEQASGKLRFTFVDDLKTEMRKPGLRYRGAIIEAMSLVIRVFVRNITDDH